MGCLDAGAEPPPQPLPDGEGLSVIYGVGVGLDLSPYYRQNRAFDLSNSVSNQVLREIVAMLAAGPRRGFR